MGLGTATQRLTKLIAGVRIKYGTEHHSKTGGGELDGLRADAQGLVPRSAAADAGVRPLSLAKGRRLYEPHAARTAETGRPAVDRLRDVSDVSRKAAEQDVAAAVLVEMKGTGRQPLEYRLQAEGSVGECYRARAG